MNQKTRKTERGKRQARLRRKLAGGPQRPRLNVFKSHKNLYLQVIDDLSGKTLVFASTLEPEVKQALGSRGSVAAAKHIGTLLAQRARQQGIEAVVFDRGGYKFHGAVKAVAEAARESGLKF